MLVNKTILCSNSRIRRGFASVDVMAIVGLIALASITALQTLGTSTNQSFEGVAVTLATAQTDSVSESSTNPSIDSAGSGQRDITMVIFAAIAICISYGGTQYIRHIREREKELSKKEEETAKLQKQSLALQKILSKRNSIFQQVDEDIASIVRGHALVGTYMSTNLVSIEPHVDKMEALARMQKQGFRRFMVKHANGDMAGVVSKQDILSQGGQTVRDVMTSEPKITTPDTEIYSALSILLENRISCLPVVEEGKLVGLLSVSDILMVLQCILRDLRERSCAQSQNTVAAN